MSSNTPAIRPHVEIIDGHVTTNSFKIAKHFGKQHKNVIRDIEILECSDEFRRLNFEPTSADVPMPNGGVRTIPAYTLTRDGFMFLAMGFTGARAAQWKEAYIDAFNRLEAALPGRAAPPARKALPQRVIRSRDDLSFTRRDEKGALVNWFVEDRAGSWHAQVSVGQEWFEEVLELARRDPEEAYHAPLFAGCSRALLEHWSRGHEQGFLDLFARFAIAGMLATRGDRPELPFTVTEMGRR